MGLRRNGRKQQQQQSRFLECLLGIDLTREWFSSQSVRPSNFVNGTSTSPLSSRASLFVEVDDTGYPNPNPMLFMKRMVELKFIRKVVSMCRLSIG